MSSDRPLDDDDMTTGFPSDSADLGGGSADGFDAGAGGGAHGPRDSADGGDADGADSDDADSDGTDSDSSDSADGVDAGVEPGTYGSRDSEGGDADAGDR